MTGFDTLGPMQDPEREARRQERFAQWQADRQNQQQSMLAAFRLASREDPEVVGEANRAAAKLGIAPELAEQSPEVVREVVKERALRIIDLQNRNPVLMRQLGRTRFMRVAHDDLENLRSTETTMEWLGRNWQKGEHTNELGWIGLRQAIGAATPEEVQRAEELELVMGRQFPGDDGFLAATAEVLGQMSETVPMAMAAGAAAAGAASVGGPVSSGAAFTVGAGVGTFTLTGAIGAGHAYRSMIRRGIPHEKAAVFAFGAGALEGGLETLGQTVAIGPFQKAFARGLARGAAKTVENAAGRSAFAQFVADYAKTFTSEVGTELTQTLSGAAVEDLAAQGVEGAKPGEDLGAAMWQTFEKTAKAMAVLSTPGPGLAFMANVAAAERTKAATQALNQIKSEAAASLVKDRDPAAYSAAVTEMAQKVGDGNVYLSAPAVMEAFRQADKADAEAGNLSRAMAEQAEMAMPGFLDRIEEAARRGDDVAIPVGEWASKLANTKAGDVIAPHLRAEVGGLSPDEAKKAVGEPEDAAKEAEKLANDEVKRAEQWDEEATEIQRAVAAQIVAAGRKPLEANRDASLMRAGIETIADRVGMTPKELWAKYGVTVQKGEAAPGDLMQPGETKTDSPEFKAWFGDSKVVDKEGKPLVVYHGTKASTAFDEFDIEKSGRTDEGWLGRGLYFTTNKYTANAYGDVSAREPLSEEGAWNVTKDRRGRVGSFYIAMRNPLVLKPEGQGWIKQAVIRKALGLPRSANPAEVSAALQAAGHDGVVLDYSATGGLGDERELMALRPEQIKSVNNRGTFDPNDPNILRQTGRAGYDPVTRTITLTDTSDFSSFAHETAHAFLSIYEDLAAQKAHPTILDDFRAFLKWAGEDEATWQGKTLEQKRKAHENFAANFESYLMEGKAPEPGLRRLFAAFSRFIKRVYGLLTRQRLEAAHRKDFNEELLPLSDDIRAVMDRMLASDEKVRTTLAIRGAVPTFQTQEESGLDDAAWADYQRRQKDADDAVVGDVALATIRDLRWLRNAKAGKLREIQAKEAKVREGVRQKVAAEVEQRPVYKAIRWLKTGEYINPDGTKTKAEGSHKIRTEDVPEALRDDLRGMTSQEGAPADDLASVFGIESGKTLIESVAAAEKVADLIERETDAKMLREHGSLTDPRKVESIVEAALHNEARRRFVASELRELTKVGQPLRVMVGAAKLQAEAALAKRKVGELTSARAFTMAARRASQQAQQALAAKDIRAAIEAKRRHLLQTAMADVAVPIPDELKAGVKKLERFDGKDLDQGKSRVIDYVYAGRALAAAYKMRSLPQGQEARLIQDGLDTVKRENPALWERLEPLLKVAERVPQDVKNVTLAEFREIVEVSDWLWDAGREAAQLNAEGKKIAMAAAVEGLGSEIAARGPRTAPGSVAPAGETATGPGRAILRMWNLASGLKRMEHWARFMDGGKEGAFWRYFVAPISRALTAYRTHQRELVKTYHAALTKLQADSGSLWDARIEAPELGFTFKGKKELLGAMLHAGSESNLAKLLRGRGWGEMVAVGDAEQLDTSRWDRTIAGFWKDGTLTKTDLDFLKATWGLYAGLLPQAQKAHKALYGAEFETIEHRFMATPFGELKGGYVPARIDRDAASLDSRKDADTISGAEAAFRYSVSTGKGFTLNRNPNYNQPLDLDLGRQLAHFDQELRFIFLQPVVNDAVRITKNRQFRSAIDAYDREAVTGIIEPWLENVALQTTSRPSGSPALDMIATILRNAASVVALGFNVANALVQVTGISNAMSQVKGSFMRAALTTYTKNPAESARVARGKSAFMAQRADQDLRVWRDEIDRATQPSVAKKVRQTVSRWAFAPQRFVQGAADVVTWHGGYAQAIAENKSEAEAIESADAAVRLAQGSQNAEDAARYESSTPFQKLFTQFGSYSNLVLNQVLAAQGVRAKAGAALWVLLLPAIAEGTMRLAFSGAPEDEDDNGTIDEWFGHYGGAVGRNVAGLLPFGGPMLLALAQSEGARVIDAPGIAIVGQGMRGIASLIDALPGGDQFGVDSRGNSDEGRDARNVVNLLSIMTGTPLAAPVRTVQQIAETYAGTRR